MVGPSTSLTLAYIVNLRCNPTPTEGPRISTSGLPTNQKLRKTADF